MSLKRTFQIAMEGLTLNKVRSFLTTLGIIIGVAAVIVMLAVSAGAEAEIADQINSLGANLIMVMPSFTRGGFGEGGPPPGLSYDDIAVLATSLTGINGVAAEESTTENIKADRATLEDISVVGTTEGFTDVRDYQVAVGRFLTGEDSDRTKKPGKERKRPRKDPEESEAEEKPKKKRLGGKRPAGCDPVLFPDPLDCPKAGPPDRDQILEVVRSHVGEIDACAKKQHAVDPTLASGKIVIRWWIKPTGHTTKVGVVTDQFKGTLVGKCIVGKVKKWHFGAWDGRRIGPINFPFQLKTH